MHLKRTAKNVQAVYWFTVGFKKELQGFYLYFFQDCDFKDKVDGDVFGSGCLWKSKISTSSPFKEVHSSNHTAKDGRILCLILSKTVGTQIPQCEITLCLLMCWKQIQASTVNRNTLIGAVNDLNNNFLQFQVHSIIILLETKPSLRLTR